jgi:hypothetical protein
MSRSAIPYALAKTGLPPLTPTAHPGVEVDHFSKMRSTLASGAAGGGNWTAEPEAL